MKNYLSIAMLMVHVTACWGAGPHPAKATASANFAGTWALNPRASSYGSLMVISTSETNDTEFNLSFRGLVLKVNPNGTPTSLVSGVWQTWTKAGEKIWEREIDQITPGYDPKAASPDEGSMPKPLQLHDYMLLDNDKSMRHVATQFEGDRQTVAVEVFQRIGEGNSFTGTWRLIQYIDSVSQVIQFAIPAPGRIRWWRPGLSEPVSGWADGGDLYMHLTGEDPGVSISFTVRNPRELDVIVKTDGLIEKRGRYSISADGGTLTRREWRPGRENDVDTMVYEKRSW